MMRAYMKKRLIPALLAGLVALVLVPFARAQPADGNPRDEIGRAHV